MIYLGVFASASQASIIVRSWSDVTVGGISSGAFVESSISGLLMIS